MFENSKKKQLEIRCPNNPSTVHVYACCQKQEKRANDAAESARVVIDGRVITSMGLSTVTDFALAIVSKFFGHARARSVAEGLVFEYPRS